MAVIWYICCIMYIESIKTMSMEKESTIVVKFSQDMGLSLSSWSMVAGILVLIGHSEICNHFANLCWLILSQFMLAVSYMICAWMFNSYPLIYSHNIYYDIYTNTSISINYWSVSSISHHYICVAWLILWWNNYLTLLWLFINECFFFTEMHWNKCISC